MNVSNTIQRQIPLGSEVVFTLTTGREIEGVLTELGREHVTLERDGNPVTILTAMIGAWEIKQGQAETTQLPTIKPATQIDADSPPSPDTSASVVTESKRTSPVPITQPDPEILRMLVRIEERFDAKIQAASIDIKPVDFEIESAELGGKRKVDAQKTWEKVKQKFAYAAKQRETHPKFGRIHAIVAELETLVEWYPLSPAVRRILGYTQWLADEADKAQEQFRCAARMSRKPDDWYNAAVTALGAQREARACRSLLQHYVSGGSLEDNNCWYVFVGLLARFHAHSALAEWLRSTDRSFSDAEIQLLRDTAIYLLMKDERNGEARSLVERSIEGDTALDLARRGLETFVQTPDAAYAAEEEVLEDNRLQSDTGGEAQSQPLPGVVYKYLPDRSYGFLRDQVGRNYFFHRTAVSDGELLTRLVSLKQGETVAVVFNVADSPRGPLAVGVSMSRSVDERLELATKYANDGDYPKAIAMIRQVLATNPEHQGAREFYEKWREYARVTGVPRGGNPYARAKRVQLIERDPERAAQLLEQAIQQGDSVESAVKDLATTLDQLGRTQEAIGVLVKHRARISSQQSVNNMLIPLYQKMGQHREALTHLQHKLNSATSPTQREPILYQIGISLMHLEEYAEAERTLKKLEKSQPTNLGVQKNLAICLLKQKRYDESERLLKKVLAVTPDEQVTRLLEAVAEARVTGQSSQIDIIIQSALPSFSSETSGFARFFLDRCDFKGVPAEAVQKRQFKRAHLQLLEDTASRLGTKVPLERAGYYLSAAKVTSLLSEEGEQTPDFYKYLSRAFASRGDGSIIEGRHPDVAREFYCEALSSYDRYDTERRRDEQDPVNAIVRYLYSILGPSQVPMTPSIPTIDHAVEDVVVAHPERELVFDAIAHLVYRSRYATGRVLGRLYAKDTIQAWATQYLKGKGVVPKVPIKRPDDFTALWDELVRRNIEALHVVQNELRYLRSRMELKTAYLEDAIERLKSLSPRLSLDLDRHRVRQVVQILEMDLDLCKQQSFEEQERLCIQIAGRCQEVEREIADNPTKLGIEELYPVIEVIQEKTDAALQELYERSAPQVSLKLPIESYIPDSSQRIEVQVVVTNRLGCSPAESLQLVVQEDPGSFCLDLPEVVLNRSLRGGDQQILRVSLRVTEDAIKGQAFSMPIYAQYSTRSSGVANTAVSNFSIRLYSEADFEPIPNPYAAHAEGGVVRDPAMFYGRDELIGNIAQAICSAPNQSKCVVVFGQKRAGKSSILHHLKTRLQAHPEMLVVDIGNIGSMLDKGSQVPLLYQILRSILVKLADSVEDRVEAGAQPLTLAIPGDLEFYAHPAPLMLFKDVFERFRREIGRKPAWKNTRVVLMIDEFSYIYGEIVSGALPESFMKNWKALLQEGYFGAILAGQDVMPKFKQRFPNEFGTTQDEPVSYLRREDAIRLIDEPIRMGGPQGESRYRERAIDRVVELTAGSPFYIQIMCNRLVEYMNRKKARLLTDADVEQLTTELITGVNALGLDKFDNLISSGDTSPDAIGDKDVLAVLREIAVNSQVGPCSRSSIACETSVPIDAVLDDLEKRKVIEQERGQYYRIRVRLFRDWLTAHP